MAAPAYVSNTSGTGTTTVVLNVPASTASGDLLITMVSGNRFSQTWSTPSGWTLVEQGELSGGGAVQAIFSRVATGSEPASYTFTFSAAFATSGRMIRITGNTPGSPVDSHVSRADVTGTTGVSIGSVSPTTNSNLILTFLQVPSGAGTYSFACSNVSSFTLPFQDTGVGEFSFGYGASTASGTAAATFTKQFNNAWWGATLSIAPPVANTITLTQGSYTLTGQNAIFPIARMLALTFGSYLLTGFAAAISKRTGWVNQSKDNTSFTNQTRN